MTQPGFEVESFNAVLTHYPQPLVIGGQAVSIWAKVYVSHDRELQTLQPFLSKDCDIYGTTDTLQSLAQATGWQVAFSAKGQASPVVGFLTGKDTLGNDLTVEVLFSVKGLDHKDLKKDALVRIGNSIYRTLSPLTLLKAKLANACELPQDSPAGKRNDYKHIRILIRCISGYLQDAFERMAKGEIAERGMVNMLEQTLKVVQSEHASRIAKTDPSFRFLQCFPGSIETNQSPKIQKFYQRRLAPLRAENVK